MGVASGAFQIGVSLKIFQHISQHRKLKNSEIPLRFFGHRATNRRTQTVFILFTQLFSGQHLQLPAALKRNAALH